MGRPLYVLAAIVCFQSLASHVRAEPRAVVQGEMDAGLRGAIERAVGETDRPVENRFEARRRARAAAESAVAVLRSEGYYAHVVEPEVSDTEPPTPLVRIIPGARFVLGPAGIDWQGLAPDPETRAAAGQALGLKPGDAARAPDVVAGEGRVVAAVQKRGYADVVAGPREVVVDHADNTVRPTFRVAAGPLVRLDGLDLSAAVRTSPTWVNSLAPWRAGDTYDPEDVAELERRLLDTGVYESVTVALAPAAQSTPAGLRPVVVSLAPRESRTIEAGASYSSTEGLGLDARWTRYNLLRRADTLAVFGRASQVDSRVGAELAWPHWRRPQQTLRTGGSAYRLRTDAYDETGFGVRADVTRRYGRTSYVTVGVSTDLSRTEELRPGTLSRLGRDLATVATLGDVLLDRSDDPLDPRRGWKLSARVEPTVILGDENMPYLRTVAQGSGYLPIDAGARTVLAGRVRLGRIFNGSIPEVPASRRFYAGGGGSVRGFPYQAVGPRLADNTPQGGLALFEVSAEVRRDLTDRWAIAGFVDAGTVLSGASINANDLAVGAGVGVRYDLGFAPIRVDIAAPVARRRGETAFQIYVSLGQSF